jgi:hypothetical protein
MTDAEAKKRLDRLTARVETFEDADAIAHALVALADRAALVERYSDSAHPWPEELISARRHMRGEK